MLARWELAIFFSEVSGIRSSGAVDEGSWSGNAIIPGLSIFENVKEISNAFLIRAHRRYNQPRSEPRDLLRP